MNIHLKRLILTRLRLRIVAVDICVHSTVASGAWQEVYNYTSVPDNLKVHQNSPSRSQVKQVMSNHNSISGVYVRLSADYGVKLIDFTP